MSGQKRQRSGWLISLTVPLVIISIWNSKNFQAFIREQTESTTSEMKSSSNSTSCFEILDRLPRHTIFYPRRFMEEGGSGNKFLPNLKYHERRKQPPDSLAPRLIQFLPLNGEQCKPIYYHIHKTGGTTFQKVKLKDWYNDVYYFNRERTMGKKDFDEKTNSIVRSSYEEPMANPGYAIIRDPVQRFPSSVAQVLKGRPNTVEQCLSSPDTLRLLFCILTQIETENHFPETHLLPQAYEMYSFVQGYDATIHLTDMSGISPIVAHLGAAPEYKPKMVREPHPRFPKFHDLVNITIPDFLKQKICKVYEMDVLMIEETKVATTVCSIIPKGGA